jgi:CubicO group peptidase (beta-lactamase class C family)
MINSRRVFIKQIGVSVTALSLLGGLDGSAIASPGKNSGLPRSTPEAQGMSSADILKFLEAVEKSGIEFHSVMIVRHGHVVAEGWWSPYAAPLKHTLYSLSKSFTSTAVGFAVSEGKLSVDDTVISFFPNERPSEVSANLSRMKVKDLLTMSTGHAKDTLPALRNAKDVSWVKTFLEQPVEYEPGTHFLYNTGATYMQSAIVQKLTGQKLIDYLKPRLFDPLGIEGMDWELSPDDINTGGYGLRVRTEDIAKFGLLYLQKGMWEGKQILPASWVEAATSKQVESGPSNPEKHDSKNDWAQGYGYQFWRCQPGGFRADGAFGQLSIVLPQHDMVVAITEESFDMQASMRLVWDHLLPAIKDAKVLKANTADQKQLSQKLKNLSLIPSPNSFASDTNRLNKEYTFDPNEAGIKTIAFSFTKDECVLNLSGDKGKNSIRSGIGKWSEAGKESSAIIFPVGGRIEVPSRYVSSASWIDANTLVITLRYIETAHSDQLTCVFNDDKLTIKFLSSISKGNSSNQERRVDLTGKRIS